MTTTFRQIAASRIFNTLILAAIAVASVTVGLLSYPEIEAAYGGTLHAIDTVIVALFVVEVVVKIAAEGRRPWRYFQNGWNTFDFLVVLALALPLHTEYVAVFRLVRILRVLRLVKALPRLQMIVNALIKSFSSMGYVTLLLFLNFYIFAALGVSLFGRNDPEHFGRLDRAFLSLFQCLTLDDWTALMKIQMFGADKAPYYQGQEHLIVEAQAFPLVGPLYFISFVLLGTMIILNLFIGVITQGMSEAQQELADDRRRHEEARVAQIAAGMSLPGAAVALAGVPGAGGTGGTSGTGPTGTPRSAAGRRARRLKRWKRRQAPRRTDAR